MIRKILVSLFIFLVGVQLDVFSQQELSTNKKQFTVHKKDYRFSTVFEFESQQGLIGSAIKSAFRVKTNYDLYDHFGRYKGTGICRILTLGALYTWGTEIDVYDENGYWIGMIDGQVFTTEPAKFSIYNKDNERVGIAYLDANSTGFTIAHPENSAHIIACLKREFVQDTVDYWHISVFDKSQISQELIEVFATFACDSQDKFKVDN